jgi:tRNA nucleotidyltransferase (CCA-adding enzyme)
MDINAILDKVLKKNRPKNVDVTLFLNRLEKSISGLEATIKIGGSFAKGTYIKDDFDCDIFIMFDYKYANKDISSLLEKAISGLKTTKIHGSRDYFQIKKNGINFEIVPVLKIKDPKNAQNVTDASPLHVDWIRKQIEKNPRLKDEIILAKLFAKSIGVYGAESYINGFSGHVIDILISYYGSFLELLKKSRRWKTKTLIDIENHRKKLNQSKVGGPLIVVDPIQPNRNAAAALSLEKFDIFVTKAKEFLNRPDESFFIKHPFDLDCVKEKYGLVIRANSVDGKKDIVGCKLLKVFEYVKKNIKDYEVTDAGWYWDEKSVCYMFYSTKKTMLPVEYKHLGPPKKAKVNFKNFIKKYPDHKMVGNRAYVMLKRKNPGLEDFIKALIKDKYIKEKVKKITLLRS